jgi:hypothetical protein
LLDLPRLNQVQDIALSCLFLSTKLEEHPTRIRDLINAIDFIVKRIDHEKAQITLNKVKAKAKALTNAPLESTKTEMKYEPMDYYAKLFYDMKEGAVIGEMQILKRFVLVRAVLSALCRTGSAST